MSTPSFWSRPCSGRAKALGLALLALCFVLQTTLVYTDGSTSPPLSPAALRGRQLWHRHNCNSCHQLYGFGGFLGPDLTNAWPRLSASRLRTILTEGAPPMPAFHLREGEIADVSAFLRAMHESGRGQARAAPPSAVDSPGRALFQARCAVCHVSTGVSPVGAPDLTGVVGRIGEAEVARVLERGRPPRMPNLGLDPAEQRALLEHLRAKRAPLVWSDVPWWEFR